ncbi:MAG TPA: hypothetical protein VF553_00655 [Pyrinomonadaceae bacterium]|jgi:hypothetical protein
MRLLEASTKSRGTAIAAEGGLRFYRSSSFRSALTVLMLACALQLFPHVALAQETELERLQAEQARAEARQAIAEAQKAEFEARFPKPTTTALEGRTTVDDNAFLESEMVAYVSMAHAADEIAAKLKNLQPNNSFRAITNLAIYNEKDVRLLQSYSAARNRIAAMDRRYRELILAATPPGVIQPQFAPIVPISAATSVVGSFIDLLALFRTDVEIKGKAFNIGEAALVSEVFRALRAQYPAGINLYYPAVFPPQLRMDNTSQILTDIQTLHNLKAKADEIITKAEKNDKKIAELKAEIETLKEAIKEYDKKLEALNDKVAELENQGRYKNAKLIKYYQDKILNLEKEKDKAQETIKTDTANLAQLKGTADTLKETITQLKALNAQLEKLVNDLIKVDEASGVNALTAFLRAENINEALKDENSYWLELTVLKAGGNNRIKRNLITTVFTGSQVSHSGGTIIEYNLFSKTGASQVSDTKTNYVNYVKAKKIKDLPNP